MKIYIGTDHAGFELKQKLVPFLESLGHEAVDFGAQEYNENDDYPDFIAPVAKAVSEDASARGIILGGSGQGEAMTANKFPHVRAAVYYGGTLDIVRLSREHNDANILSLGARFLSKDEAKSAVELWLNTPFSGEERHKRRIEKLEAVRILNS
jgi:ribose 5-phosphate isomerase B